MQNIKISLAVICLNEENCIENLLKKSQYHVDEIVVVDGGSTDKTIEICKDYNVKIIENEWDYNFSKQRNIALENCSYDWIVSLDCDEYMESQSWKNLKKIINSSSCDMFLIPTLTYDFFDNKKTLRCIEYHRRVFKNYCRYKKSIHEYVTGFKKEIKIKKSVEIVHDKKNQTKSNMLYYFMEPWEYPEILQEDDAMKRLLYDIGKENWKHSKKFIENIKEEYYKQNDFLVV